MGICIFSSITLEFGNTATNLQPSGSTFSVMLGANGPSDDGSKWIVNFSASPQSGNNVVPQYTAYAMCAKLVP